MAGMDIHRPTANTPRTTVSLVIVFLLLASLAECKEYCWEVFNATCGQNEVVLMESARYGRMQVGRCLTREYYIGCSADIMPDVDRKCSGRHECQFDVPDTELHQVQPCPKDLMAYMEADYSCVKVAHGQPRHCERGKLVLKETSGYIGNAVTEATGHGSSNCPWVISVPKGQKINVTLIDFAVGAQQGPDSHICNMYAIIREYSATNTDITVCGGIRRHKPIYLSETHEVQVEIMTNGQKIKKEDLPYFLLRYEAVGCRDMKAPDHGRAERKGEHLTVSCNHTGEVWHLICNGNEWIGDFRNCTPATAKMEGNTRFGKSSLPLGLVVAVVIGIALGIALGMLLLALVLSCQRRLRKKSLQASASESCRGESDPDKARIVRGEDYGYAHVWELQQLRGSHADCNHKGSVAASNIANREAEFGHHLLLKCPKGNIKCKEHPYESPLFGNHESTDLHLVPTLCHDFDIEVHNHTMPMGKKLEAGEDARYSN